MKQYLIDNEPADAHDVIEKAKEYGYDGDKDGIYYTSSAAQILRKNGHTVENNIGGIYAKNN